MKTITVYRASDIPGTPPTPESCLVIGPSIDVSAEHKRDSGWSDQDFRKQALDVLRALKSLPQGTTHQLLILLLQRAAEFPMSGTHRPTGDQEPDPVPAVRMKTLHFAFDYHRFENIKISVEFTDGSRYIARTPNPKAETMNALRAMLYDRETTKGRFFQFTADHGIFPEFDR
jgi:hypothetical protein